jgi:hypothetical protein
MAAVGEILLNIDLCQTKDMIFQDKIEKKHDLSKKKFMVAGKMQRRAK